MKRGIPVAFALALLVGLTACSPGDPSPTTTPTPNPSVTGEMTYTPSASQTPGPTVTRTATRTATRTVTRTVARTLTRTGNRTQTHTPRSTEAIVPPEPVGTPAVRWNGIPVMPDATAGEEDEGAYFFSVVATPDEVAAYYAEQLPPLGWRPFAEGVGENGAVLILYKKGSSILTISIIVLEDHVQVLLTLI